VVPRTASRRRKEIRLHTNQLAEAEITSRNGLPITIPARTIADVANSGLAEELVYQASQEALQRGLATQTEFQTQADRQKGRTKQIIQSVLEQEMAR